MAKRFIVIIMLINIIFVSACNQDKAINEVNSRMITEIDIKTSESIANALNGALMLGYSWEAIAGEQYIYNLSLTTFYCILNPDYPMEIPANEYESFIAKYFDISNFDLKEMQDYNIESNSYIVSPDISVERVAQQTKTYFRIDQIEYIDGIIRVSYHIVWGDMAPEAGMENGAVYVGNIYLDKNHSYKILEVELVEDNSRIYG